MASLTHKLYTLGLGFHSELIYLLSNVNQDECANLFKIVQLLAIKITNFVPSRIAWSMTLDQVCVGTPSVLIKYIATVTIIKTQNRNLNFLNCIASHGSTHSKCKHACCLYDRLEVAYFMVV